MSTKDLSKNDLKFLHKVFEHRNRTIGVRFVTSKADLEDSWEEAQFELGSRYQYESANGRVWDYYLVLCCKFSEELLTNELRFKVESDRFCCRKILLFSITEATFSEEALIPLLFPEINTSGKISILKAADFLPLLNASPHITKDFFCRPLNKDEIAKLAQLLTIEAGSYE